MGGQLIMEGVQLQLPIPGALLPHNGGGGVLIKNRLKHPLQRGGGKSLHCGQCKQGAENRKRRGKGEWQSTSAVFCSS